MLRLPWSDRFAAPGQRGEAAPGAAPGSRRKVEDTLKPDGLLRLRGAEADLLTNRVRAPDGTVTQLRRQSAAVLRVLAARRGRTVSKAELWGEVWSGVAVTDDSLTQCVSEIRRALGSARGVVVTLAREGFRLEAETDLTEPPASDRGRPFLWKTLALAGLVAVAVAGAGALPSDRPRAAPPSIAVLPFEDLAGEARWARLGRGLAAEIGADLSRGKGIVVIPAETTDTAQGEPGAVADALGVRFVMDGTIQGDGDEMRVTARLTDFEAGTVIWSARWTRPTEDVFAVQDEIVQRIGGSVDAALPEAIARAVRAGTEGRSFGSLHAYEVFLLGHEIMSSYTPEGFRESIGYFRRALELDPDCVGAMVFLSIALINWSDHVGDEAEAAALVAESFDLAEGAVTVDPGDPLALIRLCTVRVLQGRRSEAWPLAVRAVELAPLDPGFLADAAWCYPYGDQDQSPLDWVRRAVALNPAHPDWYNVPLAMAALWAGDLDLARRAGRAAPDMADVRLTLGVAEALSGNLEEARAWFHRFSAGSRYRSLSGYMFVDDLSADPAFAPWVEGARMAGFPVTDAEASRMGDRWPSLHP
jgi:TolB-like protein